MICHGFKGGIGTASRVLARGARRLRGRRARAGEPRPSRAPPRRRRARRSRDRSRSRPGAGSPAEGAGSIIVIVATDAPLLPGQCERVAQRATVGVARAGGGCEDSSGDLFLCFATGNRGLPTHGYSGQAADRSDVRTVSNLVHDAALRRGRGGDGGGDPERAARGRDDDRVATGSPPTASSLPARTRSQRVDALVTARR